MPLLPGKKNIGCAVENCTKYVYVRGLCCSHYKRWWRYGEATHIPVKERKGIIIQDCNECKRNLRHFAKGLCKTCYLRNWEKRRNPNGRRERMLKRNYGMTLADFNKYLILQNDSCAICGRKPNRMLHVDHNHENGEIRGLLCYQCNAAIGYMYDNPEIAKKVVEYLEIHATVKREIA